MQDQHLLFLKYRSLIKGEQRSVEGVIPKEWAEAYVSQVSFPSKKLRIYTPLLLRFPYLGRPTYKKINPHTNF
ncbi:hypothetical protein DRJ00_06040 [Candidatus Aerophobetes bacterium]|uniref:Uncharacterized protein n=1 Tax=Aerophobetes bacterium TaxID=2030807 RepID=A0A497E354_UNCAE|nr:MAG: hypothetical protein DRJ00_06040 [Candidatus Aerophobetes bacterium]